MVTREHFSDIGYAQALAPASRTADANGTTVDTQGFGSATVAFNVGASGITLSGANKIELEVEESDDGSTWADVADEHLTVYESGTNPGTVKVLDATTDVNQTYASGYKGYKRYIRPVLNYSGTHGAGTLIGAVVTKGDASFKPVSVST